MSSYGRLGLFGPGLLVVLFQMAAPVQMTAPG